MSLTESAGTARELADRACAAIHELAGVARDLDADGPAALLGTAQERLADESFRLMLLGRFNNGKSTLVNALIGRMGDLDLGHGLELGIVPMGDDPTTPTLISIEYADDPFVETTGMDGTSLPWSLAEFRETFVLDSDEQNNAGRFGGIAACRIGVPAELLRERVVLFDTPGVAESTGRDEVARAALTGCDAALVVYSLNSPYGHDEVAYDTLARQEHTRVFTIVNTFGKEVTEAKRRNAWNKLVQPRTGEPYAGQDLGRHDIFFVDALAALDGRAGHDEALVEKSGLAAVEERLGSFLLRERHLHHITRYLDAAESQAATLERLLAKRTTTAETVDGGLTRRLDELRPALDAIRDQANRVGPIVQKATWTATQHVRDSFSRLMMEIERELPRKLLTASLPSWNDGAFGSTMNVFKQKKLAGEVAEFAREHTTARVVDWRGTARAIVTEHLERMTIEANAELAKMERAYDQAFTSFTGWTPGPISGAAPTGIGERVGAGLFGAVVGGGPLGLIAAGGGGKKAMLAGLGGQVGAGLALGMIGVGAPVAIPLAVIVGLVTALGFGKLTREKLAGTFQHKGLPELLDQFHEFEQELDSEVRALFAAWGEHLEEQARTLAEVEEANFAKAAEMAAADQQTRDQEVTRLRLLRRRVDDARTELDLVRGSAVYELPDER